MKIPPNLEGIALLEPPVEVKEYCEPLQIEVAFVDNLNVETSLRYHSSIFVNTRGTFWANYITPPLNAKSFPEAVVLRLLHEVGHVVHQHPGDVQMQGKRAIIKRKQNFWENAFTGTESEAWEYAFNVRKTESETYNKLLRSCNDWINQHIFADKDWDDTVQAQWRRYNNVELADHDFKVPMWVRHKFNQYQL